MVMVRLRNPNIILTPITNEEKELFEKDFMGDESLYVLYRLPNSEGIHIGMMSSLMRNYFSTTANATSKAFFYNGCSNLENNASKITDRPVYRVSPSDDRMVSSYDILNGTSENGLRISLEDVVDGNYTLNVETPSVLRKTKLR